MALHNSPSCGRSLSQLVSAQYSLLFLYKLSFAALHNSPSFSCGHLGKLIANGWIKNHE